MMPLMVDVGKVVVFGGERGEGRQKAEKLSCFSDRVLVVPESAGGESELVFGPGQPSLLNEQLRGDEIRRVPVAAEAASLANIGQFVEGCRFVCSDLQDDGLNREIVRQAQQRGILYNVIDNKALCNVWFMSLIDNPSCVVGLSSNGSCAWYARRMREELTPEFARRSREAVIFRELRDLLRERRQPQYVDVLDRIYSDRRFRRLIRRSRWEKARSRALRIAGSTSDDQ